MSKNKICHHWGVYNISSQDLHISLCAVLMAETGAADKAQYTSIDPPSAQLGETERYYLISFYINNKSLHSCVSIS